jgi:hypothetical protein
VLQRAHTHELRVGSAADTNGRVCTRAVTVCGRSVSQQSTTCQPHLTGAKVPMNAPRPCTKSRKSFGSPHAPVNQINVRHPATHRPHPGLIDTRENSIQPLLAGCAKQGALVELELTPGGWCEQTATKQLSIESRSFAPLICFVTVLTSSVSCRLLLICSHPLNNISRPSNCCDVGHPGI